MRILLDESVPSRLGQLLVGHAVKSVQRHGWSGIKNGKLLALAATGFDVLLTADKGIEYQQNLATLPIAVLIVLARSNRLEDMAGAVPNVLKALANLQPRTVQRVSEQAGLGRPPVAGDDGRLPALGRSHDGRQAGLGIPKLQRLHF